MLSSKAFLIKPTYNNSKIKTCKLLHKKAEDAIKLQARCNHLDWFAILWIFKAFILIPIFYATNAVKRINSSTCISYHWKMPRFHFASSGYPSVF